MRSFALFMVLLIAALLLAAALSYPAWLLVETVSDQPFQRVMDRVAMLLVLIGLVILTRRLGLTDRAALGYDLPRREFARQLAVGWLGGVALMAPLTALLLNLRVRLPLAEFAEPVWYFLTEGIITGLLVALIEETFFRGILFAAVARTSGPTAAIIAPSLLYASLHFLGVRLQFSDREITWHHGFVVLSSMFERYHAPLSFLDSFLALAVLGMLFAWIRHRTGAIAGCIGLHAAGVAGVVVLRATTAVDEQSRFSGLVGAYDGVIGWASLVWFTVILGGAIAMARTDRR
jgi:membrane protease YdiL (CAAX protease family)